MKKTIIALIALSGMAVANTSILTFDQNEYSFDTDKWALNGLGIGPGSAWEGSFTLKDNTVATMSITGGKFWDYATDTNSWTNTEALTEMNAKLGTTITADDLASFKIDATAAQGSKSTLTLDFSKNTSYSVGSDIAFYLLVATTKDGNNNASYQNFTVSGLTGATVTWASATGDGFNDTAVSAAVANLTMIKVTGKLAQNEVQFAANASKNGWAMVSYTVPEPTTATLSLLALAGLAARRRRASR